MLATRRLLVLDELLLAALFQQENQNILTRVCPGYVREDEGEYFFQDFFCFLLDKVRYWVYFI